jgi:sugar (pentulose or hexulose) kinase
MSLLGLDVGTSGCKACVFDGRGRLAAYAYQEYGAANAGPERHELDPAVLWDAVKTVIGKVAGQCPAGGISAIGVSSFGESAVPVGRQGNALGNIIPAGTNDILLYFQSGRSNDPHGVGIAETFEQRVTFAPPNNKNPPGTIGFGPGDWAVGR